MAVLRTDSAVPARSEIAVAGVTGEPFEPPRERPTIALGDPAGEPDALAGAVVVARTRRLSGESVQAIDAFVGERHGGV